MTDTVTTSTTTTTATAIAAAVETATSVSTIQDVSSSSSSSLCTFPLYLVPLLEQMKQLSENIFLISFVIAICQAIMALIQYKYNPNGYLMVPPGRTEGIEYPTSSTVVTMTATAATATATATSSSTDNDVENDNNVDMNSKEASWFLALKDMESSWKELRQSFVLKAKNQQTDENVLKRNDTENNNENQIDSLHIVLNRFVGTLLSLVLLPWTSTLITFIIERNIHLLQLSFIIGIIQLFDIFPKQNQFHLIKNNNDVQQHQQIQGRQGRQQQNIKQGTQSSSRKILLPTEQEQGIQSPKRIIVIGDSLAAGVGTIDVFEGSTEEEEMLSMINNNNINKNENKQKGLSSKQQDVMDIRLPGPIFPKVLASTIAKRTGHPVHWKSIGYVGGDIQDIETHCLPILQKEVEQNNNINNDSNNTIPPPDYIFIICGINDLKLFAMNPIKNAGPIEFRQRLIRLITKIRQIYSQEDTRSFSSSSSSTTTTMTTASTAAETAATETATTTNTKLPKIILPAIPTQMFRRHSPLNIFPLFFFLSTLVAIWDIQKKIVASTATTSTQFPSNEDNDNNHDDNHDDDDDVQYFGISTSDIYNWYMTDTDTTAHGHNTKDVHNHSSSRNTKDDNVMTLIAADGVHPNAKCYTHWATTLANQVLSSVQEEQQEYNNNDIVVFVDDDMTNDTTSTTIITNDGEKEEDDNDHHRNFPGRNTTDTTTTGIPSFFPRGSTSTKQVFVH